MIDTDSRSEIGGIVVGSVVGSVVLLAAIFVLVVSIYLFVRWKTKQRVKNLQKDISAMYVVIGIDLTYTCIFDLVQHIQGE